MRIGVVVAQDFWTHLRDIYGELQTQHTTAVFRERRVPFQLMSERANRRLLRHDLSTFVRRHDLALFEWCEHLLVTATHLPKSTPIVGRLHLHELWDFAPHADWAKVDGLIFVSSAMERKFLARYPQMQARTTVIHNGVSLARFRPASRPFGGTIGVLGRIEPHKRIYDLVLVLKQLRDAGFDLRLRIGGAATEERYYRYDTEVRLLVERTGLDPFVTFDGWIRDTPSWLQQVDIFVSHSCSEGLQVALLEAMASGCYCLSHAWDGAQEALPPDCLYWTESELIGKVAAFSALASRSQEEQRRRMRQLAEQQFDIDEKKVLFRRYLEGVAG